MQTKVADNRITTLILDFDGTLADTVDGIVRTAKATLKELSLPDIPRETIVSHIGLPLGEMFKGMTGIGDEAFIAECMTTYRRIFKVIALDSIVPFPGVKETLRNLKEKGISLNIASSRSRGSIEYFLKKEGMEDLFDIILGAGDTQKHKPHPEMVLKILEKKGIPASEALMVGDTTFDIMMGHSGGCRGCGVTYGNHSRETLSEVHTEYLIDSFPEIESIILNN